MSTYARLAHTELKLFLRDRTRVFFVVGLVASTVPALPIGRSSAP
jgi:hypothetical protein